MRKILLIFLLLSMLVGCTSNNDVSGNIIEVNPTTIMSKMDDKEDFFLLVTLSTCPICAEYQKVIDELVLNYPVDVYHIVIDKYEGEYDQLSDEYLNNLTDAPDTFFIVKGEIVKEKVGFVQYRDLTALLKEYDFVK